MPEPDAVAFLERLLVPLAQRHHRAHVDLVEGREHRGGALRFDAGAWRSSRGASTCARALRVRSPATVRGDPRGPACAGCACARLRRGAAAAPVGLRDRRRRAAASTSRFITRPASPLPRTCVRSTSFCCAALRAAGVARRLRGIRSSAASLSSAAGASARRRRRPCRRAILDDPEHVADLHVGAVAVRDLAEHAGLRRRDLDVDLVGLELDERLADGDGVAFLLQPLGDARVDDRLADFRHDDVSGHMSPDFTELLRDVLGRGSSSDVSMVRRSRSARSARLRSACCCWRAWRAADPSAGLELRGRASARTGASARAPRPAAAG